MARGLAIALLAALGLLIDAGAHATAASADVKLDVQVDKRSLSIDDALTLQVSVESRGAAQPDVKLPAFEGFEIVRQQVSRPMQFSFNFGSGAVVQSSVIYSFVLHPLRTGQITIKPVVAELEGQRRASSPISIAVSAGRGGVPDPQQAQPPDPQAQPQPNDAQGDPQAAPTGNLGGNGDTVDLAEVDDAAFIRTVADKAQPYLGEQVTVTMYLYVRDRLQSNPQIETEPTADGFWVHDLLNEQNPGRPQRQVVQGAVFTVYPLRRFAAFPLRDGELTIGPMGVRIDTSSVFDVFGPRRGNPVLSRKGAPVTLKVKPLPERNASMTGQPAVGRYSIVAKLDRAQTATGDAVTLNVTVHGQGNVRTVSLPKPSLNGLDILDPEVKDLVEAPSDRVGGTRELRYLIVPREPGHYTLPAFEIAAFDAAKGDYVRVASEALTLDVVGNAINAATAPSAQPDINANAEPEVAPPAPSDHEWRPIRTQSALLRKEGLLVDRPWFWAALALPALAYAGLMAARSARRRLRARSQLASNRADREAREKLDAAADAAKRNEAPAFYSAAASALLITLEARLGEPATGFTHSELRKHLIARGADEALARDITSLLDRADHSRFGGASTASGLQTELDALKQLRARIAAFQPKEAA